MGGKPKPPKRQEKPAKYLTDELRVTKIPQPHGGALNSGGTPGHRGGSGRPPSALRARLTDSLLENVPILEAFASDEKYDPADRLRAIDLMGKYGPGTVKGISLDDVRERLHAQREVLQRELEPDVYARLVVALRAVWA